MVFAFFSVECSKIDSQTQKCNSNLDCATNEKYPYCLNGYCNVNPKSITRVHLVFMDDLKVGFTGNKIYFHSVKKHFCFSFFFFNQRFIR